MMYTNDNSGADLSNGHHVPVQMVGPHQTEELYKRSVMLVIWYKVSSDFLPPFISFLGLLCCKWASAPIGSCGTHVCIKRRRHPYGVDHFVCCLKRRRSIASISCSICLSMSDLGEIQSDLINSLGP